MVSGKCWMKINLPFTIQHSPFEFYSWIHTKRDALRPFLYSIFVLFALFFVLLKKLFSFFKLKAKTRPFIHLGFHLNFTSMGLNDVFYDGKS